MISRRSLLASFAAAGAAGLAFPAWAAETELGFDALYEREAVLSAEVKRLDGQSVEMTGYMAPPLKAEAKFFVLTRTPLSVCPFCETEAQWPDDIVLVLTNDAHSATPYNVRIRVAGILDLGFEKDAETGFVSLIRIMSADFERA